MPYIKISSSNLKENINIILKRLKDIDKLCVVIKDNAYSHGLKLMAKELKKLGVKKVCVRNIKEAILVKDLFPYILVFSALNHKKAYESNIKIAINSLEDIAKIPKNTCVELKVNTGMNRHGIDRSELKKAFCEIKKHSLILEGVFTHYRNSNLLSSETFWQEKNFEEIKNSSRALAKKYGFNIKFHSANSSTFFRAKSFQDDDMVRLGLAVYGYLELDKEFDKPRLKPILSLFAKKISTMKVKKGQRLGYGALYESKKDTVCSSYDIGYGDGFFRMPKKKRYISPDGYKLMGQVSMGQISLDTDKKEVCIFKDLNYLAKLHKRSIYEILLALKENIKKIKD